jgi:hypothetical protein
MKTARSKCGAGRDLRLLKKYYIRKQSTSNRSARIITAEVIAKVKSKLFAVVHISFLRNAKSLAPFFLGVNGDIYFFEKIFCVDTKTKFI